MDNEFIQNLRYKLQKRMRRLNSMDFRSFHFGLKLFWQFIDRHKMLRGITDELAAREPTSADSARRVCEQQEALNGETESEHAAISYFVLKWCVEKGDTDSAYQIAHHYGIRSATEIDAYVQVFRELFLEPLYEYIDENLDDQRAMLALLRRYKHKCEWFARDSLFKDWEADTQRGERGLAQHMYEYLHDQGIDFHIEPQSASGEADLIAMQRTDDPLIADAKIFDPDRGKGKSYIAKGFAQVYRYTVDFNEPFGYLIIYVTGKNDLRFTLKEKTQSTPFITYNNKTIFLLVIDIFPHEQSASKRGPLSPTEITEEDLVRPDDIALDSAPSNAP